jgi:type I restriction enzyme, S subunit
MNRYSSTKGSKLEWIGDIPEHWDIKKLKFTTIHKTEKCPRKSDLPYIGLENIEPKTGKLISVNNEMEESDAKKFLKEDVLFGKLRPYLAKVLLCNFNGRCSGEFLVLKGKEYLPDFLQFLLLSDGFIKTVDSSTYGAKMPRAEWEFIGNMKMPILPFNSQREISQFLSKNIAHIEENIVLTRQVIRLLRERRQVLINHLVTRGLNPTVSMKDSGIVWIGEVPEHWKIGRIKNYASKIGSGVTPKGGGEVYVEKGIPLIRSQNVHFDELVLDDVVYISHEIHDQMKDTRLRAFDVLLNITGASLGRCVVVPKDFGEGNVSQHVCIIRPKATLNARFLCFYLSSTPIQSFIYAVQVGASRQGLTFEDIGSLTILFPPTVNEQNEIVEYLDMITSKINIVIKNIRQQIEKLQEYRQSLISSVVTGKIDVGEKIME